MIPIKIHCGCGQKYAFDVEPVDGRMEYAVRCPVCGADGTAAANELIAQQPAGRRSTDPGVRLGYQKPRPAAQPPIPRDFPASAPGRARPGTKARKNWLAPAIVGGVGVILVGTVLFGRSSGQGQKTGVAVGAENDGLPRTLAELNAWYVTPPAEQNAATFFSEGFQALQVANFRSSGVPLFGTGKLPALGSPMPASMRSAVAALVGSNREALQLFAQAAKYDECRYPVDLTRGAETAFPHLIGVLDASRLLELAALLHAEAHDPKAVADDLSTGLALAGSLNAEPYLFSQIVRARVVAITVAALEQSLNRAALPSESSVGILKVLQRMEDCDARGEGFNRGVIGERASVMALLERPEKFLELLPAIGADIPAERRARMAACLQKGKLRAETDYVQQSVHQLRTARSRPYPDRLRADDLIRHQIAQAATKKLVLAEFLLSGLRDAATKEAGCLASLRLGVTAMALEQFRAGHENRYPAALAELTPGCLAATPTDPFDGQPLRYRPKNGGYLLYSIGPDQVDDSGERLNGKEGDLVFAVVTPVKVARSP